MLHKDKNSPEGKHPPSKQQNVGDRCRQESGDKETLFAVESIAGVSPRLAVATRSLAA